MRKTNYLLLLFVFITSCKVWDPSMINVKKDTITPKLMTLEKRIEDVSNTAFIVSEDELKLFTKEVEENLIDPYGDKYGYIALKSSVIKYKEGGAFFLISIFTYCIPNLLGMPFLKLSYKIEVEIRILDKNNKLIAKYSAIGESKVTVALYYGYKMTDGSRKCYTDALNDAFSKIRPQIQPDVNKINDKLNAVGKI
jgi:hypothetical protein